MVDVWHSTSHALCLMPFYLHVLIQTPRIGRRLGWIPIGSLVVKVLTKIGNSRESFRIARTCTVEPLTWFFQYRLHDDDRGVNRMLSPWAFPAHFCHDTATTGWKEIAQNLQWERLDFGSIEVCLCESSRVNRMSTRRDRRWLQDHWISWSFGTLTFATTPRCFPTILEKPALSRNFVKIGWKFRHGISWILKIQRWLRSRC